MRASRLRAEPTLRVPRLGYGSPATGGAGLVLAQVGLIGRVGGALRIGAERERRHAAPGERLDGVAHRREWVGILAVSVGSQDIAPRPAFGERRRGLRVELDTD